MNQMQIYKSIPQHVPERVEEKFPRPRELLTPPPNDVHIGGELGHKRPEAQTRSATRIHQTVESEQVASALLRKHRTVV